MVCTRVEKMCYLSSLMSFTLIMKVHGNFSYKAIALTAIILWIGTIITYNHKICK